MNKALKELIAQCEPYVDGTPFSSAYLIPSGKLYNGFWGKNGFNKFYIVCNEGDKHYLVGGCAECDLVEIRPLSTAYFDIPNQYNALLVRGNFKFVIFNSTLSIITIEEFQKK